MTYLDPLADLIRSCLPSAARPPGGADDLFRLYAVLLRAKGTRVTDEDVHDAWSAWMQTVDDGHASLVPFEELSPRRGRRTRRTRRRYGRRRGGWSALESDRRGELPLICWVLHARRA